MLRWLSSWVYSEPAKKASVTLIDPSKSPDTKAMQSPKVNSGETQGMATQQKSLQDNNDYPPLPDTNNNPSPPDNANVDELAKFQNNLREKKDTLDKILDQLEKNKIALKGNSTEDDTQTENTELTCRNSKLTRLSEKMFHVIKECVEPANAELDELLEEMRSHIENLSKRIETLCDALNEVSLNKSFSTNKSDKEKRQIAIEICDIGIEVVIELKDFIDNVLSELDLCLQSEKYGEIALNLLVQIAVFVATNRTLGFNLTFAQTYRNSLNNRIEQEKIEIEKFETDAIGTLEKALNSSSKLKLSSSANVGNSGMFAPQKDLPIGNVDTTSQELKPAM